MPSDRPFDDDDLRRQRGRQRELLRSLPDEDLAAVPALAPSGRVRASAERIVRDRIDDMLKMPHAVLLESMCRNESLRSAAAGLGEQTNYYAELTLDVWQERRKLLMEASGFEQWLEHLIQLLRLADVAASAA